MYQTLLVPMALDHDISPRMIDLARTLRAPGGTITALHVHETAQGSVSVYLDEEVVRAGYEKVRAMLADKLAGYDDVKGVIVKGHSARTILDYSDEHGVDCIVIGSHKPGLSDYFLGSTSARVVRHAKCAVHVHRSR